MSKIPSKEHAKTRWIENNPLYKSKRKEDLKFCLKSLLEFIEISKKLLEKKGLKGNYDIDIIYHLKATLDQYFSIIGSLRFDKK